MSKENSSATLEKIMRLCTRRGFILPNSAIYGSLAGFYDYGPLGVALKRRLEAHWWHWFVESREDVVGIDGSIITHPKVWQASGHIDAFQDLAVSCTLCNKNFRADHLIESVLNVQVDGLPPQKIQEIIKERGIVCPECHGFLKPVAPFNLMFKTHIGALEDVSTAAYLRPETAQLIFANFKHIALASRRKLPFGIAQIGKAFRNEISPRQFVFRCREFTQMELEYFIHPARMDECQFFNEGLLELRALWLTAAQQEERREATTLSFKQVLEQRLVGTAWHAYWLAECLRWLISIGIKATNLRLRQHLRDELSHYSCETWDVEYRYPWGWKELLGVANRGDYDLKAHAALSGADLTIFDDATGEKVTPYVIEPSFGLERALLTLLLDAFDERDGKTILRLKPGLSPIDVGIFPLVRRDKLPEKAREVYGVLRKRFACVYDEDGSIGRRYARIDEVGTPLAVTIDYQTLQDDTVTLRDRDTMQQQRVAIADLGQVIAQRLGAG